MNAGLREAGEDDLPRLTEILNHAIVHTTAVWSWDPLDLDNRRARFAARRARGFPVLVAENQGHVLAYASYGPFVKLR